MMVNPVILEAHLETINKDKVTEIPHNVLSLIMRPHTPIVTAFSMSGYRLSQQPKRRESLLKLNEFRKRVHEVVDLCKGENNDVKGDLNQVVSEERKIYDMLNQDQSLIRRTVSQQSFPQVAQYTQQQTVQYGQPSYK